MFNQSLKDLFTSKTNWTAITMIVVAIVGYIAKEYTLLGMLFIRDAIAKV